MLILSVVRKHRLLKTKKLHIYNLFITFLQIIVSIKIPFQNNVMLANEGPLSHESNFKTIETVCRVIQSFFAIYVNQAGFKKLRERLCAV